MCTTSKNISNTGMLHILRLPTFYAMYDFLLFYKFDVHTDECDKQLIISKSALINLKKNHPKILILIIPDLNLSTDIHSPIKLRNSTNTSPHATESLTDTVHISYLGTFG